MNWLENNYIKGADHIPPIINETNGRISSYPNLTGVKIAGAGTQPLLIPTMVGVCAGTWNKTNSHARYSGNSSFQRHNFPYV